MIFRQKLLQLILNSSKMINYYKLFRIQTIMTAIVLVLLL